MSFIDVCIKVKEKVYDSQVKAEEFDAREGFVNFRKGVLISGRLGKNCLGSKKTGLIYFIIKHFSNSRAALFMSLLSRFSARFIESIGMSFGLEDVTPSPATHNFNKNLFKEKNRKTLELIKSTLQNKDKTITYKDLNFE